MKIDVFKTLFYRILIVFITLAFWVIFAYSVYYKDPSLITWFCLAVFITLILVFTPEA